MAMDMEDGIRSWDLATSHLTSTTHLILLTATTILFGDGVVKDGMVMEICMVTISITWIIRMYPTTCLLYTSDAADE